MDVSVSELNWVNYREIMVVQKISFHKISLLVVTMLIIVLTPGCSDRNQPDNREPVLEITGVTDITRTEAQITAVVHKNGRTNLTHLAFYYGEPGDVTNVYNVSDPEAEIQTLNLRNLKAGTTYACYLTGGTSTASLRSNEIQFSTLPNELPSVSAIEILASGPVGVIVSLDITGDGGEALLSAGCDVTDSRQGLARRIALPVEDLTEGKHRLNITGLEINTEYTLTSFACNSIGERQGDPVTFTTLNSLMLQKAGTLSSLFDRHKSIDLKCVTIAGEMNGDDFRFLRFMLGAPRMPDSPDMECAVTEVNLSGVNIVEGGATYDGSRYTETDIITTDLLANCVRLQKIELPASATRLQTDALANCTALKDLLIPAGIESLSPSSGCTALEAIEVSAANENYTSIDGVLFNNHATEILWFPLGKTGDYRLPETITAIGENAFYGTSITGLEIPSSVTTISRGAFAGTSLTSITLPDNLTNISEAMFQGCVSLTTVTLGSGTAYIGNYAFDGTSITDLYIKASIPPLTTTNAFYNRSFPFPSGSVLHVPAGCKDVYRNHKQWGLFSKIVEFQK